MSNTSSCILGIILKRNGSHLQDIGLLWSSQCTTEYDLSSLLTRYKHINTNYHNNFRDYIYNMIDVIYLLKLLPIKVPKGTN